MTIWAHVWDAVMLNQRFKAIWSQQFNPPSISVYLSLSLAHSFWVKTKWRTVQTGLTVLKRKATAKPLASRLRLANQGQLNKHKIEEDRERREKDTKKGGWWKHNGTKKEREREIRGKGREEWKGELGNERKKKKEGRVRRRFVLSALEREG